MCPIRGSLPSLINKMIIFIPIKHNSQRVHRKNLRDFGREPLFKHTLLKFKDHRVFVDTDSDEIANLIQTDSRLRTITTIKRRSELCGDKISVCELIKDFILRHQIREPLAQIHVTSPFLEESTLVEAYKHIGPHDSVIACNKHQSRFWRQEAYGYCPVNHNPTKMEQTQDLPVLFEENSAFYIFKPEAILGLGSRIGRNPYFYVIDKVESIDIDTEDDWNFTITMKDVLK